MHFARLALIKHLTHAIKLMFSRSDLGIILYGHGRDKMYFELTLWSENFTWSELLVNRSHIDLTGKNVFTRFFAVIPQNNSQRTINGQKVFKTYISFLPFYIIWRTFFHNKDPFVKQRFSKGPLCNLSDKMVLLWNCEEPSFLIVQRKTFK